jgi:hypothetical protein
MYDRNTVTSQASTTLRLKMGYEASTSNFVFKLFNSTGVETLSLDANGNAVFSGDINTSRDVNVGNNIYLGKAATTDALKGIYYNSTVPITASSTGYNIRFESSDGRTGLLWDAFYGNLIVNSTAWASISGLTRSRLAAGGLPSTIAYFVNFESQIEMTPTNIDMHCGGSSKTRARMTTDTFFSFAEQSIRVASVYEAVFGLEASTGGTYTELLWFSTNNFAHLFTTKYLRLGASVSTGNVYLGDGASTNLVASRGWGKMPCVQIKKIYDQSMSSGGIITFDDLDLQIGKSTDMSWSSSDNGIKINSTKVKSVEVDLRIWAQSGEGIYSWVFLRKNSTNIASGIQPARMVGQEPYRTHSLRTMIAVTKGDVLNSFCAFSGAASTENKIAGGTYANSCVLAVKALENN